MLAVLVQPPGFSTQPLEHEQQEPTRQHTRSGWVGSVDSDSLQNQKDGFDLLHVC